MHEILVGGKKWQSSQAVDSTEEARQAPQKGDAAARTFAKWEDYLKVECPEMTASIVAVEVNGKKATSTPYTQRTQALDLASKGRSTNPLCVQADGGTSKAAVDMTVAVDTAVKPQVKDKTLRVQGVSLGDDFSDNTLLSSSSRSKTPELAWSMHSILPSALPREEGFPSSQDSRHA
ncbi:hypothetical protein NliqN6_6581 [Naganishia liquefaciens]|uniref:Uncharacterized protein n=1 Tax=Naganishia liquefaciens TaxID=104408 RepID=A0A8H3TZY0_9TREE|nr:hypothetical protein NliqN6_6581 [Naganishia liquefaciens]